MAHFIPDDDGGSGWWRLLPEQPAATPLTTALRVPAVVIGGGFTGLAIARALACARPDWTVVVLDAQRVGYGASGRNSGFVGDLAHRNPRATADETARFARVARWGARLLRNEVVAANIDCHWSHLGRLHVARGRTSRANLEHLQRSLRRSRVEHTPLDAAGVAGRVGTGYYTAGVHLPDSCLVQPAALARGLAGSLPENVVLHEDSPVVNLAPGPPWALRTPAGSVESDRLYIAAGGFSRLLGVHCDRVVPLLTFGSLTRALTPGESRAFGGDREWGLVSEDRMGTSIRRTQYDRLLVRNCVRYRRPPAVSGVEPAIANTHRAALRARWPHLELALEHTWGGVMSMTLNQGFVFGQRAPMLFAATGYNGTGVAMGTALGTALAQLSLDERTERVDDALALPGAGWTPPGPILGWGVRLYTGALQWRASGD